MTTTIQFVNLSPTAPIIDSIGGQTTSPATAYNNTPDIVVSGVESGDTLYLYQDGVLVATEEAVDTTHTFTTGTLLEQTYLFKVKRNNGTKTSAFSTTFSYTYALVTGPVFPTDFTKLRGNLSMNGTTATFTQETQYYSNTNTSNDMKITGTFKSGSHFMLVLRGQSTGINSFGNGDCVMTNASNTFYRGYDGLSMPGINSETTELADFNDGDTYEFSIIGTTATFKKNGSTVATWTPHYSTGAYTQFYVGGSAVHDSITFEQI